MNKEKNSYTNGHAPQSKPASSVQQVKKSIKTAEDLMELMADMVLKVRMGEVPVDRAQAVFNGCWKIAKTAALSHRFGEFEGNVGIKQWTLLPHIGDDDEE